MPTIERYTKGIVRERAVADTVNPQAINTAGSGFRAAAGVAGAAADVTDKFVQAQEATAVNEAIIKNKKTKLEYLEKARQENMANPADFAKRIEPELQKIDAEMESALPTGRAKGAFKERMAQVNLAAYEDNFTWAKQRQVEMFGQSVENATLDLSNMAYKAGATGGNIDDLIKDAQATVVAGSTIVAPEKIQDMQNSVMKSVQRNYVLGLMESDPNRAIEALKNESVTSGITAGDRQTLIETAENVIEAEKKQAEKQATLNTANASLAENLFKQRIYSGQENPKQLALELAKAEANGEIEKSFAVSMRKVITAQKQAGTAQGGKIAGASNKAEFESKINDMLLSLKFADEGLNQATLKEYNDLENTVADGVANGLITPLNAEKRMKGVREYISTAIKDGNTTGWSVWPGIQDPLYHALPKIKEAAGKNLNAERKLTAAFADYLGRVNEKGEIAQEGEYTSSGNATVDEARIMAALNAAKKHVNMQATGLPPKEQPSAVVDKILGTFANEAEAEKAAKANNWPDGAIIVINGQKVRYRK